MSREPDPVDRLLRQRVEQGLPRRCSDRVILARVAAIIANDSATTDKKNGPRAHARAGREGSRASDRTSKKS